ncbi:MAG TPA: FHA domain-containing protein [Polyangiales bacterium]|nr:FHA domain-containing protein [Polyangiales bacterium]
MVRLVISDTEGATTVVPLLRDEVTIGRKDGNTIRLTERNISRRHAQLIRVGTVYKLRDLDSYNGVLINGQRVQGEADIAIGDQIQLGDYTILVEEEVAKIPVPEPAPAPARRPTVPARLVMLTQPSPGAEFALPTDRDARLGRSEEVDCPINHRSVSREHAQIKCDADGYVIEDLGSANGVTVNGRSVKDKPLRSGDIIELGQVVFRYVGPGEHYFFDPGEATRYRGGAGSKQSANLRLALVLGGVAVAAAAILIVARNQPGEAESENGEAVLAATAKGAAVPASTLADDGYERALTQCRSALSAGRFVEARAHGTLALKLRPEADDARDCMSLADQQYNEEQAYVRGKTALQAGDLEKAYSEFSALSSQSPLRTRPEVAQATAELARVRLGAARSALPHNRAEAANIAESVLSMASLPSESALAAQELIAQARSESQVTHAAARTPLVAARPPVAAPVRPTKPVVAPPKPAAARPKPAVAAVTPVTPAASSSDAPAMELASACLARGDNECVIRALEGKASSERELGLLIETYRQVGDVKAAQKNMGVYLKRFPTTKRSDTYRKMLELQNE